MSKIHFIHSGKRATSEPENAVRSNSEAIFSVNHNSKFHQHPYILINILDQSVPAFLDQGSSGSIIGSPLIHQIHEPKLPILKENIPLDFLVSSTTASETIKLNVTVHNNTISTKFILLPECIKPVLLGRDFLHASKINISTWRNGWTIGENHDQLFSFINPSDFPIRPSPSIDFLLASEKFTHYDPKYSSERV